MLKKQTRIIAWDDCSFTFNQKRVRLIGVIFRGADFMDGLLSTEIEKDGNDSTNAIADSIINSRHYSQLSYIMTDGISFGGLNILDIKMLYEKTNLPVIAVVKQKPDRKRFVDALRKVKDSGIKEEIVKRTGNVYSYENIWYQCAGMEIEEAEALLKMTCTRSYQPEPLRIAHIIASGLSGESRGRA